MAEPALNYHRGEQDIHEQQGTFHHVLVGTKWATLHLAVLIVFLTLWFCTGAGFLNALISAIVLAAIGIFALHERKPSH
jgi:aa3 type cytochrome c oxidase subunit IV